MEITAIFWKNLDRFSQELQLGLSTLSTSLKMNPSDLSYARMVGEIPSAESLMALCRRYNIAMDDFFKEEFNVEDIARQIYLPSRPLPKKYHKANLSKTRTVINLLKYAEQKFPNLAYVILREHRVPVEIMNDPNISVNIKLMEDIVASLTACGFKAEDLVDMGKSSYFEYKDSPLGLRLRAHKNMEDMSVDLCENMAGQWEKNFNYQVYKVEANCITYRSRFTEECLDLSEEKIVGNEIIGHTKTGVFESFPYYLGYTNSVCKKTKSIYQGDGYDEHKVYFA